MRSILLNNIISLRYVIYTCERALHTLATQKAVRNQQCKTVLKVPPCSQVGFLAGASKEI